MNILGTAGPGGDRAQGRMGSRPPNQAESKRPSRAYLASHWSNLPPPPSGPPAARAAEPGSRGAKMGVGRVAVTQAPVEINAAARPGRTRAGGPKKERSSKRWSEKVKQNSGQTK